MRSARPRCPVCACGCPLRSAGRVADGWLVELGEPGEFELSPLEAVVSPVPVLRPEVWTLARRAADRAAGAATDVLRIAIPGRQARVEKAWLARDSGTALCRRCSPARSSEYAGARGRDLARASGSRSTRSRWSPRCDGPDGARVGRAVGGHDGAGRGGRDRGAAAAPILCVPDHRDQRQLELALASCCRPSASCTWMRASPNPDRYRAFLRCLGPDPLVIVGNRSVVYAPAERLGLIAIWDDGDPLYAEPLAPYVNARDAALLRQEQQGAALLMLGHSRSTEVAAARRDRLDAGHRARPPVPSEGGARPPSRQAGDRLAEQARIPSSAWRTAREALEHGPVLVQVARPGYAPGLACADCGQTARCRRCEGPLVRRTASAPPGCAWCGALAVGWSCSNCHGHHAAAGRLRRDPHGRGPGPCVPRRPGDHRRRRADRALGAIQARARDRDAGEPNRSPTAGIARCCCSTASGWCSARACGSARTACGGGRTPPHWPLAGPPRCSSASAEPLATALATWQQTEFARQELDDRRRLRFPPAVRVATVTGAPGGRAEGRRRHLDRGGRRARAGGPAIGHRAGDPALRLRRGCGGRRGAACRGRARRERPPCRDEGPPGSAAAASGA